MPARRSTEMPIDSSSGAIWSDIRDDAILLLFCPTGQRLRKSA